jgi:hypothetical protein
LSAVEGLATGDELVANRGRIGDAQRVALAASYRHAVVEHGQFDVAHLGGAEEVGDLAGPVEMSQPPQVQTTLNITTNDTELNG